MHDYWTFAVTIVVIMAGILFNRQDVRDLRAEINGRLDRIETRMDRIGDDLKEFYRTMGQYDVKLENLEKKP